MDSKLAHGRVESRSAAIIRCVGSVLLILAASLCTMGALISAFGFPVQISALLIIFLIASLASALLATFFRGKGLLALIPPILAVIVLRFPEVVSGAKWALFFITEEYSNWMNVPVLFEGASENEYELTVFFAVMGVVQSFFLAVAICLRRSTPFTVALTAPLAAPSLVILFYVPNHWYIMGLLAVYLTMLVCSAANPDSFISRGNAVFPAVALALLLIGSAYMISPPEKHGRIEIISDMNLQLRNFARRAGFDIRSGPGVGWPRAALGQWRFDTEKVSISDAGSRAITGTELLEVTSSAAGVFYLRGYSMRRFDGRSWLDNSADFRHEWRIVDSGIFDRTPSFIARAYMESHSDGAVAAETMTVAKTGDLTGIPYLPYYNSLDYDEAASLPGASHNVRLYQTGGGTLSLDYDEAASLPGASYDVRFYQTGGSILALASGLKEADAWEAWGSFLIDPHPAAVAGIVEPYLQIEEATAERLRGIAARAGIDEGPDRARTADSVAAFVSSSAQYSLMPRPIPEGEDFAPYFLSQAQSGYCIHFATAATLMLRALGIPARFTTGYLVTVPPDDAGQTVPVTDRQAHAWVEVFYDEIGWLPLEVTPPSPESDYYAASPMHSAGAAGAGGMAYVGQAGRDLLLDDPFYREEEDVAGTAAHGQQGDDGSNMLIAALAALALAALAPLLLLRARFARDKRNRLFAQADTNAAAICAWRYILRLAGKAVPPAEAENLALKARFSQHRLTERERGAMIGYAEEAAEESRKRANAAGRFWSKHILGL